MRSSRILLFSAIPFGVVICMVEPGPPKRGSEEQAAYLLRHVLEIAYVTYANISLART